ncbi:MAG: 16S rRNA (cytosine(967)-C(5))-methyltransferase RsmB, partial [Lachnospiraceae bacterium]|nr:16S rRNA (cytosine(967)-C(5))-methyltransferase RsmB [Lachnospiraceae bacterium]
NITGKLHLKRLIMDNKNISKNKASQNAPRKVNARLLALDVVYKTMSGEEYIDKVLAETLDRNRFLGKQERSFISRLSKGCIERIIELDYCIAYLCDSKNIKLKPVVRDILRLGLYQIIYMDAVPDSAAVNESVKLAEIKKVGALKGFINGVLRNAVRLKDEIPYPGLKENPVKHYSVWYSMPEWIVKYFMENYPDKLQAILESFYEMENVITFRTMLSKGTVADATKLLNEDNVITESGRFFDYAIRAKQVGRLTELKAFSDGRLQVQDESSMLVGAVANVSDGMQVLDVCSAPGGKAIHIADDLRRQAKKEDKETDSGFVWEGDGRVTACDVNKHKVKLIRENLKRLQIHNVKLKVQDATEFNPEFENAFDVIIADLPCSGLGVLKKKCDIKYKTKYKDIAELAGIQKQILGNVVRYLKVGGTLIFSTCTITKEENVDNYKWIRKKLGLKAVSIEDELPECLKGQTGEEGYIQVLPGEYDTDGFFVSKFVKE